MVLPLQLLLLMIAVPALLHAFKKGPSLLGAVTRGALVNQSVLAAATQNIISSNGFSLSINAPTSFAGTVNFAQIVNFAKKYHSS